MHRNHRHVDEVKRGPVDAHVTSLFLIWLRSMHIASHSCNEEPFVDYISF